MDIIDYCFWMAFSPPMKSEKPKVRNITNFTGFYWVGGIEAFILKTINNHVKQVRLAEGGTV